MGGSSWPSIRWDADDFINRIMVWNMQEPWNWIYFLEEHNLGKQVFRSYAIQDTINFIKPIWTGYSPIISIILISLFILILGLILPKKPVYIKFLTFLATLYIIICLYTLSFNNIGYNYCRLVAEHYGSNPAITELLEYRVPTFPRWVGWYDKIEVRIAENVFNLSNLDYFSNIYDQNNLTFNWYPNATYYTNFFFISASITVILLLLGITDKLYLVQNNKIEFLLLVLFIYLGSIFMLNCSDFICILILLECIAFSSYILVGFERQNKFSSSSGLKYLILGAVPGGCFVLGITLLYKNYGSFFLNNLETVLYLTKDHLWEYHSFYMYGPGRSLVTEVVNVDIAYLPIFTSTYIAIILIFTNLFFKLTAAPLHMWAPSIYGGAPLPSVAFLSVFSKLTLIFLTIYFYISVFYLFNDIINVLLLFSGVLSIVCAVLGAFSEKLIKRFFVYSSMGHVGFMLLGISAGEIGLRSTIYYLLIYVISSFILWFIVMYLTKTHTRLTNLKVLSVNHPVLALILSLTMFSLSGIPPLAGFFVKFEIFNSILNSGQYFILLVVFILTVFSFFYYLRIIKIIYFENTTIIKKNKFNNLLKLRLISILIGVLVFFVFLVKEPLLIILENSIISLFYLK